MAPTPQCRGGGNWRLTEMANDTPFVDLPTPPASSNQPVKEANIRGNDFAATSTDDEYLRAIAYRDHIVAMTRNKRANLLLLAGSKEAYQSLQRKTLPLTEAAPPYIEADS